SFSSYANHRYLHSFPTRRSSDLSNSISNSNQKDIPRLIAFRDVFFRLREKFRRPLELFEKRPRFQPDARLFFVNCPDDLLEQSLDRKSTRLNSSHVKISYAVFCL